MASLEDKNFIPYRLEVLTPVFIGSGEDISPLEYVIREIRPNIFELWFIDTQTWLSANAENPELKKELEAGNMAALRNLLNRLDPGSFIKSKISITNPDLAKDLMLKRENVSNRANIQFFMRNPYTCLPYLPASSIKGALSTPLADFLMSSLSSSQKNTVQDILAYGARQKNIYSKLGKTIFGQISENPMRHLRLADISLPPGSTTIRNAKGFYLQPGKTLPKTPCETLEPNLAKK